MLLNYGVGEYSWESLRLQRDPTSQYRGSQVWIFTGSADAEVEALILWPPDAKSQLIRKDLAAEKDWRQEEQGMPEDEMVGLHHRLNVHEFEQAPGDGEWQGSMA